MSMLKDSDPKIFDAIRLETERQEYKLELIASENYRESGGHGGRGAPS